MALIPPEVIDEIQSKVDILDLVSRYVTLRRAGKNYTGLCPFHSEDTPSFTVTPEKQIFYCFGCQKGGGAVSFIMEMEGLSYPEAVRKLARETGVEIPEKLSPQAAAQSREKELLHKIHSRAAAFYAQTLSASPCARAAREYLKKRGIGEDLVKAFGLGYAPEDDWEALAKHLSQQGFCAAELQKSGLCGQSAKNGRLYDKFHGRLLFPICDHKGQVVAFGGRIVGEGQPKYLNSPETPIYNKSSHLYGLSVAHSHLRRLDEALIMEGYMDVLAAHQFGLTNAVASLGTAFTAEQARLLKRYTARAVLAYDGDAAGIKATHRALEILRAQGFQVKVLSLPSGLDPDDFLRQKGRNGWEEFTPQGALEYLLDQALRLHDSGSAAGKGAVVKALLPAISQSKSEVERDSFIRLLAGKLSVPAETVYADLRKSGLALAVPKPPPSPAITPPTQGKTGSAAHLLKLALEDEAIFRLVEEELGLDFWPQPQERDLAFLTKSLIESYTWQPSTLLSRIDDKNEGLRGFLLKLLTKESPDEKREQIAKDYIAGFRAAQLEARMKEVRAKLAGIEANDGEMQLLMREMSNLAKKLQAIKAKN
ncbi:MAG: DNA primase [Clostridiales bacterium]|nr:DNA primase [Clostridiales bacterium]